MSMVLLGELPFRATDFALTGCMDDDTKLVLYGYVLNAGVMPDGEQIAELSARASCRKDDIVQFLVYLQDNIRIGRLPDGHLFDHDSGVFQRLCCIFLG